MDATTQTISFLIILLAFVVVAMASAVVLRRRAAARRKGIAQANVFPLREMDAYEVLPTIIGQSIEADRPVLFSTGAARLGDDSTLVTLAGTALSYYVTQEVSISETPPVFLTSETSVIPLAYGVLRRAYLSQNRPVRTNVTSVRWYPSGLTGERSLVFAAMLTATIASDRAAGNVFVGRFGEELALALLAGQRQQVVSVAGSDTLPGQAVAYAMADGALLGEEVFSPVGYLGDKASERGALAAQDLLRWMLVGVIVVVAVYEVAGAQLGGALAPLFNLLGR